MPIDTVVLSKPPHPRIAGVSLGLTLYLEDATAWAREHASTALAWFLPRVGRTHRLGWYSTSLLEDWCPYSDDVRASLVEGISNWTLGRPRHLFWFSVADDPHAGLVGFTYREIDDEMTSCKSTLELRFAQDATPEVMLEIASEIANRLPIWCGVGGYQIGWNPLAKSTAFWAAYRWCLRYMGVDVQDAPAAAWHVASGVPGTNWLTLLGHRFAHCHGIDTSALRDRAWTQPIAVETLGCSTLLRAGAAPTLGDVNRLEYPAAYAEVARALAPHFMNAPPEFPGGFHEAGSTRAWMRRLLEPSGWTR